MGDAPNIVFIIDRNSYLTGYPTFLFFLIWLPYPDLLSEAQASSKAQLTGRCVQPSSLRPLLPCQGSPPGGPALCQSSQPCCSSFCPAGPHPVSALEPPGTGPASSALKGVHPSRPSVPAVPWPLPPAPPPSLGLSSSKGPPSTFSAPGQVEPEQRGEAALQGPGHLQGLGRGPSPCCVLTWGRRRVGERRWKERERGRTERENSSGLLLIRTLIPSQAPLPP